MLQERLKEQLEEFSRHLLKIKTKRYSYMEIKEIETITKNIVKECDCGAKYKQLGGEVRREVSAKTS